MKVYEEYRIVGIYKRKDSRKHILLKKGKIKKTVSYPKYLMEIYLNRYLNPNETVDHKDRDFTNNDISNLQVLDRKVHSKLDAKRLKPKVLKCPLCKNKFKLVGTALHNAKTNRDRGKFGTFCSRSCAGKFNSEVQYGKRPKPKVKKLKVEYEYLEK